MLLFGFLGFWCGNDVWNWWSREELMDLCVTDGLWELSKGAALVWKWCVEVTVVWKWGILKKLLHQAFDANSGAIGPKGSLPPRKTKAGIENGAAASIEATNPKCVLWSKLKLNYYKLSIRIIWKMVQTLKIWEHTGIYPLNITTRLKVFSVLAR